MKTELLSSDAHGLERAAQALKEGKLVAVPTETVYGLAGNALDSKVVVKIFEAKGRPSFDPLIVHASDVSQLDRVVDWKALSPQALLTVKKLSKHFWPGPLTLVLPKTDQVPLEVTSHLSTVAVRIPRHPVFRELLSRLPFPLAAPSANRFGSISPTSAAAALVELDGKIDLVLDGGSSEVGVESTVLTVDAGGHATCLRPGGVSIEAIQKVLGTQVLQTSATSPSQKQESAAASPGLLDKHYAPAKKLILFSKEQLTKVLAECKGRSVGVLSFSIPEKTIKSRATLAGGRAPKIHCLGTEENAAARGLFSTLRELDSSSETEVLLAEIFPSAQGLGAAIRDRLKRASFSESSVSPIRFDPNQMTVDLHCHLFMKQGLGWLFKGDFFCCDLERRSHQDRFRSQANPDALDRSGLGIVVACLYAHPLFAGPVKASIRRQLAEARRFLLENPNWVLARSAEEARAAINSGKRVMVLALEGASWVLESEADLREFIDEAGIRIVTFMHFIDDRFGGAAFMRGLQGFAAPWGFFKSLVSQIFKREHRDQDGHRVNPRGLTQDGKWLAKELLARGVWIDLSHSSDATQQGLQPLLEKAGQPPLYTHTTLRRHYHTERALSDSQLQEVADKKGMIGLMPTADMLIDTPEAASSALVPASSEFKQFLFQYEEIARCIGADRTVVGTDTNGGIGHLPELMDLGELATFWKKVQAHTSLAPHEMRQTVETFLDTWDQVGPRRI